AALLFRQMFVRVLDYPVLRTIVLNLMTEVPGLGVESLAFMVASIPIGYACWTGLAWINRLYERKAFSDIQLQLDTLWLIVVFDQVITLSSDLGWKALLNLLAFLAYRGTVALGLKCWRFPDRVSGPRLLLLRVFGYQRRTEKLFDVIAQRWRACASVQMIAGADLGVRTLDAGDFLAFLGGRMKQQFVIDGNALRQKLAQLDAGPDPDGQFRVVEFFCHDNTWRPTLAALLRRSDVVVMDLRSFSKTNSGCVYELQQLVEHKLLNRALFVVDKTTDVALLESTLLGAVPDPNTVEEARVRPTLNLIHLKKQSWADLARIHQKLCQLKPALRDV
ncbi:MAG: hypothetical protein ACREQW_11710, partial [Candidatus Binatia bacterium]